MNAVVGRAYCIFLLPHNPVTPENKPPKLVADTLLTSRGSPSCGWFYARGKTVIITVPPSNQIRSRGVCQWDLGWERGERGKTRTLLL